MANPVYSQLLWHAVDTGAGTYQSPPVPAGYRWVIRTGTYVAESEIEFPLSGITFRDDFGAPICGQEFPYAVRAFTYQVDLHHVLNTGDHINATLADDGWSWRFSGYQLTLP